MSAAPNRPRIRMRDEEDGAGHGSHNAGQDAAADMPLAAASPSSAASASPAAPTPFVLADAPKAALAASPPASAGGSVPGQSQAAAGVQPLPEQFSQPKRPRRSPRFACHMDRLAVVELQLVLQCLDKKSKLAAARCSRRLLQSADHPFAWQGPSLMLVSTHYPQLGSLLSRSLLRHAPIHLMMFSRVPAAQVALIPRLRELTATVDLPSRLLTLPALQGLQTFRLCHKLSAPSLRLLASLSQLRTLEVEEEPSHGDWSWLPAIPALTDLDILLLNVTSLSAVHEAVGQCARLHSLRLVCPNFPPGAFRRFCSALAMRCLRQLRLVDLDVSGWALSADEWRAGFSALAQLESLRLEEVEGIDLLLPHLAHAPALRTLVIPSWVSHGLQPTTHHSEDVLRQLLAAAPRLQVRLQMAGTLVAWRSSLMYRWAEQSVDQRRQVDEQWRRLQRMAAEMDRVAVVEAEEEESTAWRTGRAALHLFAAPRL